MTSAIAMRTSVAAGGGSGTAARRKIKLTGTSRITIIKAVILEQAYDVFR